MQAGRTYWILQLTGWTLYTLINIIFSTFMEYNTAIVLFYIQMSVLGLALTHLYRMLVIRFRLTTLGIVKLSLFLIPSNLILAAIWFVLIQVAGRILFMWMAPPDNFRLTYQLVVIIYFNLSVVTFLWTLLYFGLHFFLNYKQSEINRWKLEAKVKESELNILKAQINPHFMFNSLNNIRALILEDPAKAREMLGILSDLLRYSLNYNLQEKVPLRDEIEMVENYLHLAGIQLEDRLQYHIEWDQEMKNFMIPPMLIQILVENSVKHGIAPLIEGGHIQVNVENKKQFLQIRVVNTGKLRKEPDPLGNNTHIGLHNASERLSLMYGEKAGLLLYELDQKVYAEIKIPF